MSDSLVDLSTALEMTIGGILCINTIILVTFLSQYLVCKIIISIKLYSPHCHFDWSGSGMEKSFFDFLVSKKKRRTPLFLITIHYQLSPNQKLL